MKKKNAEKRAAWPLPLTVKLHGGQFSLHPIWMLAVNAVLILLIYSIFRRAHFDGDAYLQLYMGWEQPMNCLKGGRPVAALIIWALQSAGFHFIRNQAVGAFALMAGYALSATLISIGVCRGCAALTPLRLVGIDAAVLLAFVNPMAAEWFSVTSAGTFMGFAFVMMSLGVLAATGKGGWGWSVLALLLVNAADNVYQIFFEFFIIFGLTTVVIQNGCRLSKKLFWASVRIVAIGAGSAVLNVLISRAINAWFVETSYRASSFSLEVLLQNLKGIVNIQSFALQYTFDYFPKGLLLGFFLFMSALLACRVFRGGLRIWDVLWMALLCGGCYCVLFLPHVVSVPQLISPRTMIALPAIASMAAVWAVCAGEGRAVSLAASAGVLLMLAYSGYTSQQLSANYFVRDALDRAYVRQIEARIQSYEADSGIEIRYVSFEPDSSAQLYHKYMPKADLPVYYPVMALDSDIYALNYITGRCFIKIDTPSEVYDSFFAGKDWDCFMPEEQMIFQGDTLYMAVY